MTDRDGRAGRRATPNLRRAARRVLPTALAALALAGGAAAQPTAAPSGTPQASGPSAPTSPAITVYGFVKAETIYDTRQVADVREGQFLLYPLPDSDPADDAVDANGDPNLNLTAIQSRLGVRGSGARALGADVSGVLEGDFFGGPTNDNISLFILRHANVKLAWPNRELVVGQDWSPMFAPLVPGTVSFNTGAPFQPFARQPQVRLTLRPTPELSISGAVAGQRDAFADIGGTEAQQRSGLPIVHAQVRYGTGGSVVGLGAMHKTIRPLAGGETFGAGAVQAFARFEAPTFFVQTKVTAGGDLTDHLMTGGYVAVADANGDATDAYAPLDVAAGWVDVGTRGAPLTYGLFAGYLQNLGTADAGAYVAGGVRGPAIGSVWRVAPRVSWRQGPLQLAAEVEVTAADHRTGGLDERFRPQEGATDGMTTNVRGLLAAFYHF